MDGIRREGVAPGAGTHQALALIEEFQPDDGAVEKHHASADFWEEPAFVPGPPAAPEPVSVDKSAVRKNVSLMAKAHKYCSRPSLNKGFERRRARTLNPVNGADAHLQTVLRDGVHGAQLLREKAEPITRAVDWVLGTKRVRREEGYGGLWDHFVHNDPLDEERVGLAGMAAYCGVMATAALPWLVGAAGGAVTYPIARIIKPNEWKNEVSYGGWIDKCGRVTALPVAAVSVVVAETCTEATAGVGVVAKNVVAAPGALVGAVTGVGHGFRESARVKPRGRPTYGFGL